MFNSWLHLLAFATYLGAVVGLQAIFIPALAALSKHDEKISLLARGLKLYNPLQTGALGILVLSGAFQLTALKAAYRELFVKQVGWVLAIKLLLAFALVLFSVHQSMGIAHRFVRRHEAGEPLSPQELDSLVRRLKGSSWLILALTLMTAWVALRL